MSDKDGGLSEGAFQGNGGDGRRPLKVTRILTLSACTNELRHRL
jgi:hypothetical protein